MNTEYVIGRRRASAVPIPQKDVAISDYAKKFKGTISFVTRRPAGEMDVAFQMLVPGFDYDLGRPGKGPSHGWAFFTSYNTEQANTLLEVNASKNDKDFIAAVNWKKAEEYVAQGKAKQWPTKYYHNYYDETTQIGDVGSARPRSRCSTRRTARASIYFLPTPKSPHGVDIDPTGEYIVGGGKLATVIPVHSFSKMSKAIESKAFEGEVDGIPVLKYDAVIAGEVQNPGLGPLHTEFDGKGYAYTSVFISLRDREVEARDVGGRGSHPDLLLDRPPDDPGRRHHEAVGQVRDRAQQDHQGPLPARRDPSSPSRRSSSTSRATRWRCCSTSRPSASRTTRRRSDANMIREKQVKFFELTENKHPWVVTIEAETGVDAQGQDRAREDVDHPHPLRARQHRRREGGRHGVLPRHQPRAGLGRSARLRRRWEAGATPSCSSCQARRGPHVEPKRDGVYPFYCTDFCSALHQEM